MQKTVFVPRNLWLNTEAPWLETLRLLRSAIGRWSTWKPLDVGSDGRICSENGWHVETEFASLASLLGIVTH